MLNIKKYHQYTTEMKTTRHAARGLLNLSIPLLDGIHNYLHNYDISGIESVLELGVGGGGAHQTYAQCGIEHVYGIEVADPNNPKHSNYFSIQGPHLEQVIDKFPNIKISLATDAYHPDTPDKVAKLWDKPGKYDIIVDDAANGWPVMKNSLPVWKDKVGYAFISYTPDGYGISSWWDMTPQDHLDNFRLLEEQGMLVFDMSPYKNVVPGKEKDWNAHWVGLWMPNWQMGAKAIEPFLPNLVQDNDVWDRKLYRYRTGSGLETQRSRNRGFLPLQTELMDIAFQNNIDKDPTYVELGIGAGAPHEIVYNCLKKGNVIGVDYTNLEAPSKDDAYGSRKQQQLIQEQKLVKQRCPGIILQGNTDAYSIESGNKIRKMNNNKKFDVIIDDASPTTGALMTSDGLCQSWESHMSDTGVIISQTPWGNGTPEIWAQSLEWHQEKANQLAQEQGMIIFDLTEFKGPDKQHNDDHFFLPYLAVKVFSPIYLPVLEKYKKYIMAGNYEHLLDK